MKNLSIIIIVIITIIGAGLILRLVLNEPETKRGLIRVESPLPVFFSNGPTRTIELYYYNPELDKDEMGNIACSKNGLAAVVRQIPITQTPIQDALNILLRGELTENERAQSIETEYPLEGFSLRGASLNNGILTLEFNDPNNMTVGGACRIGILWFQIEATSKQFPEVKQVRFLPEEIFQP